MISPHGKWETQYWNVKVLPGSSWWLWDTWHKRERRLSYRRVENSSGFDDSAECWIESPESNCKHRNIVRGSETPLSGEFISFIFLPDGVSSRSGCRGGRGGEAAVAMEVLYGPTPGRVYGRDLTSGLRLLAIKPKHKQCFPIFLSFTNILYQYEQFTMLYTQYTNTHIHNIST